MSVTEFPLFFRVSSVTRKRSSMTCARSFTRYFFLNKLTRFTLCTYSSFFIILRPRIKKCFCFPWEAGFKGSRKKELSSNSPFLLWSPHPFLPVYACISRHFLVLWPWRRFSTTKREIREIKIHGYRKRQTSDSSWEFLRIENKQIKTVPNDSYG